jgi:hypothetical protein
MGDPSRTDHTINVLGAEKCTKQSMARQINGIIFKLTVGEVRKFDKREGAQEKVSIPWEFIELYNPDSYRVNKKDPVYIYKMCGHYHNENDNFTPSQAYIDTTVNGLDQYDHKMAKMFFETTVGLPRNMNTYKKWKAKLSKRVTEYLIASHYGKRY